MSTGDRTGSGRGRTAPLGNISRGSRGLLLAVLAVVAPLAVSGCNTLPQSGTVHRESADRPGRPQDAPYFSPPGPPVDGSPTAVASGFLVAMQANPLSTSVARRFLSEQAQSTWKPNRGTIVYEAFTVIPTITGAQVRLADTRRLDARGGWLGDAPGRSQTLSLRLVSEQGQWRIDNPVNALVIPTSFFDRSFARFNLYFFDQTGRVLLPDPVFIPRGEQTATNLVRGLIAGPGAAIDDISRSALPLGTDLDLSVVVTQSGVAEVPLTREVLRAPATQLSRAVDQLAWTLRQVPGIARVRITVAGAPVPLPGGRIDAPVTTGAEFDAGGIAGARLWGLRSGRVVDLESSLPIGAVSVPGPFGRPGYSLRSLAVGGSPEQIAAVASNGSSVYLAPAQPGATSETVTRPLLGGTDVLRPSYDMFGNLWLVDSTRKGARVLVVSGGRVRQLAVPGVTGASVSAFSVALDGSRLAVAYAGKATGSVRVTDILRTDEGIVSGAGSALVFAPDIADAARIIDIGWRDPATLAVLTRPADDETSQVEFVSADGSPADPSVIAPSVFRGAAQAMVVTPSAEVPLRLITPDQRLYTLSTNGNWPRTSSKVTAATYAR